MRLYDKTAYRYAQAHANLWHTSLTASCANTAVVEGMQAINILYS